MQEHVTVTFKTRRACLPPVLYAQDYGNLIERVTENGEDITAKCTAVCPGAWADIIAEDPSTAFGGIKLLRIMGNIKVEFREGITIHPTTS